MKVILLTKRLPQEQNASLKAPEDIQTIFRQNFGTTYQLYRSDKRIFYNLEQILNMLILKCKRNKKNTILFVQWPLYPKKPYQEESVFNLGFGRTVAIIHDIDSLRFYPGDKLKIKQDIKCLNQFDVVICHNIQMQHWLQEQGLHSKIITIDVFDYLASTNISYEHSKKYRIVFAGNLDKSEFLAKLKNIITYPVFLYGPITQREAIRGMNYMGSFSSSQIVYEIQGEFGLIWDGDNIDSCSGNNGLYMQYNNPHKLSLYLACGLPVITWKKAAIAGFIEKNQIGFTVDSLREVDELLNCLEYDVYLHLLHNVHVVQQSILKGHYTKAAIDKAISMITS